MIYHIAETTSTNDLAREERYGHGDVICAERQTAGRGQRGHTWTSPEGVNLLFSVVLCPTFLPAGEQFLLSQAVALALVDTLGTCGIDARIKWTNDICAACGGVSPPHVPDRRSTGLPAARRNPFHGRDPRCPRRGRVAGRTPRRHVARLSFQGDRVRGEKIAGGVGNEKIRRIFVSPARQAAGIRDADHPAGQKAGTARPVQPAERPLGSHRCDGNG